MTALASPAAESGELLNPKQAAKHIGMSPATLANLRCSGNGPPFFKIGAKFIRYDRVDVDAWMRSQRYQSTSERSAAGAK